MFSRPLETEDLGLSQQLDELRGEISFQDKCLIVRIGMIKGKIRPAEFFRIKRRLEELARDAGAKKLVVEANVVNEELLHILLHRYNATSNGHERITVELE